MSKPFKSALVCKLFANSICKRKYLVAKYKFAIYKNIFYICILKIAKSNTQNGYIITSQGIS